MEHQEMTLVGCIESISSKMSQLTEILGRTQLTKKDCLESVAIESEIYQLAIKMQRHVTEGAEDIVNAIVQSVPEFSQGDIVDTKATMRRKLGIKGINTPFKSYSK